MARAGKLDLRLFQQELAARLASKTAAQVESSRLGLSAAGPRWLLRLAETGEVIATPPLTTVPLTRPWFLGVALIGFTYLQIRILRKVEFRRANTN